jgi:hypothetical protein
VEKRNFNNVGYIVLTSATQKLEGTINFPICEEAVVLSYKSKRSRRLLASIFILLNDWTICGRRSISLLLRYRNGIRNLQFLCLSCLDLNTTLKPYQLYSRIRLGRGNLCRDSVLERKLALGLRRADAIEHL